MTRLCNIVLFAIFLGSGAILMYIVIGHDRFLTSVLRSAFFLGIPTLGLSVSIGALFLPVEIKLPLTITLTSAIIGVYAAELYLTLDSTSTVVLQGAPGNFDTRTKFEVVTDMRKSGLKAYPAVLPGYFLETQLDGTLRSPLSVRGREVLPLGGVARSVTVLCNEPGYYVKFKSDRYGFNNPDHVWVHDSVDVLAVGDSFTQGYCVDPQQQYMSLIRSAFPKTVNLGVSGNGPLMEFAALAEYGSQLRPKVVLWFFFEGNDVQGNLKVERRSPLLMNYLKTRVRQQLADFHDELDRAYRNFIDQQLRADPTSRGTDAGPLQDVISFVGCSRLRSRLFGTEAHGVLDFKLFEEVIKNAVAHTKSWGGKFLFVYIPTSARVINPESARSQMILSQVRRGVIDIVTRLGIEKIDLLSAVQSHPDPLSLYPFRSHGHFNKRGHAMVAQRVLKVVDRLLTE